MGDKLLFKLLREERRKQKIKQSEIALELKISCVMFSRYETGKSKPKFEAVESWANALGLEIVVVKKLE